MGDETRSGRISYGVTAVGLSLAGLVVVRATTDAEPFLRDIGEGLVTVVLAAVVAVLGVSLDRFDVRPEDVSRVFGWTLLGGAAMTGATGWFIYFQAVEGAGIAKPYLAVATPAAVGALAGTIVGVYDAQQRAALARVDAERENLALLNRLLRHNVRNGVNVIHSRVDSLRRDDLGEDGRRDLSIIDRRADRIADLVERVQFLTDRPQDLRPVALAPAVEAAVDTIRDATGPAANVDSIRINVPPGTYVRADEGLSDLIELLLLDVIERSDAEKPTVRVLARAEGSIVTLEAAVSAPDGAAPAPPSTAGEVASAGRGFVRSLAARYDGTVALEASGTAIVATLQRTARGSDAPSPGDSVSRRKRDLPPLQGGSNE